MKGVFVGAEQQMEVVLIDLFVSGCEPIASALNWAILCMIAHPEVQLKCHEEIDAVSHFHIFIVFFILIITCFFTIFSLVSVPFVKIAAAFFFGMRMLYAR